MARLRLRLAAALILLCAGLAGHARAAGPPGVSGLYGSYDRPVLTVETGMHQAVIFTASADRDGRWLATGSYDKTVRVWSLDDGRLDRTIVMPSGPGDLGKVYAVAISPDGSRIAVGGWMHTADAPVDEHIYVFDRASGNVVAAIDHLPDCVIRLAFSRDGTRLAAALAAGGLRVYRTGDWTEAARDEAYPGEVYGLDFAPDGRLATAADGPSAPAQGAGLVRTYAADLAGAVKPDREWTATDGRAPFSLAYSPDGATLAIGFDSSPTVDLLDAATLARRPGPDLSDLHDGDVSTVAWSPDGSSLFFGGQYDDGSGNPVFRWTAGRRTVVGATQDSVMALLPLPGGDVAVASAAPFLARLGPGRAVRWAHPSPHADFTGQPTELLSASRDGLHIGFAYDDSGTSRADFDLATLRLRLNPPAPALLPVRQTGLDVRGWNDTQHPTLAGRPIALEENEFARSVAIAPDARSFLLGTDWWLRCYDAAGQVVWLRSVPEVVSAVDVTADGRLAIAAVGDGTIRWFRMSDGVELLAFMPLANRRDWIAWTPEGYFDGTEGALPFLRWLLFQPPATQPGATQPGVIQPGATQPVASVPAGAVPGFRKPGLLPLILQEGDTARALGLLAQAEDRERLRRLFGTPVAPGPQLHLLSIGVGAFGNPDAEARLHLRFPGKDARDFAAEVVATQRIRYADVKPETLADEDASKNGILTALHDMRDAMAKGGGNDLAVVFFSGHGVRTADGQLYLLPYDADVRDESTIEASGLWMDQLRAELTAIAAHGRVLVLLDACHAGGATADGTPLTVDSTALGTGLAAGNINVITSSRGDELSREDPAWGHGAFTAALLRAFTDPAAVISPDHLINGNGLANYLAIEVPRLSDGQHPQQMIRSADALFAAAR